MDRQTGGCTLKTPKVGLDIVKIAGKGSGGR